MSRLSLGVIGVLTLLLWAPSSASGQAVISARSGVVHFFEGSVFIGDRQLEPGFGKFPDMADGAELRTAQGRAEVLLTPGVLLRINETSAIRMLSNNLADTRVELLGGSAILESMEAPRDTSAVLIYKNWQVRVPEVGVCRIDSEPPQVTVYRGVAEVSTGRQGTAVAVKAGERLPLSEVLVPDQSSFETVDAFSNWAMQRSRAVSADNAIAAQIVDDPSVIDSSGLALGGYTYFPPAAIYATGSGMWSPYGFNSWYPYSLYSPGYIYRTLYPGWPGGGRYIVWPSTGTVPRTGGGVPHRGVITSPPPRAPSPPPPRMPAPRSLGGHR